jgi:hypothetical protein
MDICSSLTKFPMGTVNQNVTSVSGSHLLFVVTDTQHSGKLTRILGINIEFRRILLIHRNPISSRQQAVQICLWKDFWHI